MVGLLAIIEGPFLVPCSPLQCSLAMTMNSVTPASIKQCLVGTPQDKPIRALDKQGQDSAA